MNRDRIERKRIYALDRIKEPICLDIDLLSKQINMISNLTAMANNDIGALLTGVNKILEIFENLPKGEYVIKVNIQ